MPKKVSVDDLSVSVAFPGVTRRFLTIGSLTWIWYEFQRGATVPKHSHSNEQLTFILKGSMMVTTVNARGRRKTFLLEAGDLLYLEPNATRTFVALEDGTIDVDVFVPPKLNFH